MAKIEQTTNSSLNVGGLGSPGTPINVGSGPGGPNVNPNSVPNVQVTPSGDNGDNTNNTTPPEIFLSNGTTPFTYNKSSKSGLEITFTKNNFVSKIKVFTPSEDIIYGSITNNIVIPDRVFDKIGTFKLFLFPYNNTTDGSLIEISVNCIDEVNVPVPDIQNIEYPSVLRGADFVGYDVDFDIKWESTNTDYIKLFVGNDTTTFTRLSPSGTQKLNVKELLDTRQELINEQDSVDIPLTLVPVNSSTNEVVEGRIEKITVQFEKGRLDIPRSTAINRISEGFINQFDDSVFSDSSKYLTHLLHFYQSVDNKVVTTWTGSEGTLILKLYEPLPTSVQPNQLIWVSKLQSSPIIETVTIVGDTGEYCPPLKGPNFTVEPDNGIGYQIYDDVVASGSQTSTDLLNTYLGSDNIDTKILNIQYTSGSEYVFSNFVNFGSAYERVENFVYKVELIESYQTKYDELTNGSAWTGSISVRKNADDVYSKLNEIKRGFDGFEYFLYNNTSSLAYPKVGNQPVSVSTSEAESWYLSLKSLASDYDKYNQNYLVNNLPEFIKEDSSNSEFTLFLDMVGQHYDTIWSYIKGVGKLKVLEEKQVKGMANNMVYHMLKSFGWDAKKSFESQYLWEYVLGKHKDGTEKYSKPLKDANDEIWRRILNNLPYLLKHKGTKRSVQAIMACYGVPQSLLTIMEFGGPQDPTTQNSSIKYTFDDQSAAIRLRNGSSIEVPWHEATYYNGETHYPNAVEMRFKPDKIETTTTLLSIGDFELKFVPTSASKGILSFGLNDLVTQGAYMDEPFLFASVSTTYFDYTVAPLDSGDYVLPPEGSVSGSEFIFYPQYWTNLLINREDASGGGALYTVHLQTAKDDRLIYDITSSIISTFASWNTGSLTIGGNFSGSIDEFRLWRVPLEKSKYQNHTLFPDSINGNSYTASTADLMFRLDFELPKNRTAVDYDVVQFAITQSGFDGSITPGNEYVIQNGQYGFETGSVFYSVSGSTWSNFIKNVAISTLYGESYATASGFYAASDYPYQYTAYERVVTANIPSTGYSLGNKVRFEEQELVTDLSYRQRATKKAFDQAPIDSNRLGIFFSPIKELNMDIIKSFGDFNIDNYIGNPADEYKEEYTELKTLRNYYFERFDRNLNEYIRLVKYIDKSLFDAIEDLTPARSKVSKGLLIEPHYLERSKTRWSKPVSETGHYETSVDANDDINVDATNIWQDANLDASTNFVITHEYTPIQANIVNEDYSNLVVTYENIDATITTQDSFTAVGETPFYDMVIETPTGETIVGEVDTLAYTQIGMNPNSISNLGLGLYSHPSSSATTIYSAYDAFGNYTSSRKDVYLVKKNKTTRVWTQTEGWPATTDPTQQVKYEYVSTTSSFYEIALLPFGGLTSSLYVQDDVISVSPLIGYLPTHYKFVNNLTEGLIQSYYKGSKQTQSTTPDGLPAVETFTTNPNILRVASTGRGSGEPILEVE